MLHTICSYVTGCGLRSVVSKWDQAWKHKFLGLSKRRMKYTSLILSVSPSCTSSDLGCSDKNIFVAFHQQAPGIFFLFWYFLHNCLPNSNLQGTSMEESKSEVPVPGKSMEGIKIGRAWDTLDLFCRSGAKRIYIYFGTLPCTHWAALRLHNACTVLTKRLHCDSCPECSIGYTDGSRTENYADLFDSMV